MTEPRLLSFEQAADYLGISVSTLRRDLARGGRLRGRLKVVQYHGPKLDRTQLDAELNEWIGRNESDPILEAINGHQSTISH